MKKALVTGSSSGIGNSVAKKLLSLGYELVGVSRNMPDDFKDNKNYTHITCDLSDEKETIQLCESLKDEEITVLVNCAGFGKFEPHEELNPRTITRMCFLNLTTPMLLTNALLRSLKKNEGYLINISSIEALRASKFAGVYSATKAGLKAFSDSLFEESRKSSLSVTNINPDMTQSYFYDSLRFDVSDKENEKLYASDISDAVEHVLTMRKGAVVSEYTIRSLNFGIKKKSL